MTYAQKEDADQPGHSLGAQVILLVARKTLKYSNSTNGTEVQTNEHMNGRTKRRKLYTPRHKCPGYNEEKHIID